MSEVPVLQVNTRLPRRLAGGGEITVQRSFPSVIKGGARYV